MSTAIYEFTAHSGTEYWSPWPDRMDDGIEDSYAYTSIDGRTQKLITNECDGSDLGAISRVELRFYGYGDDNDQVILTPVFGGSSDGDDHTVVPGVSAGWKAWQNITDDAAGPAIEQSLATGEDSTDACYDTMWRSQTFATSGAYSIAGVSLCGRKVGSSGDATVSIRATTDSEPSGNDLVSETILEADLPTSVSWVQFDFDTPYSLSAATKYAIVVRTSSGNGVANCFELQYDSDNGYADGGMDYSADGDIWDGESAANDYLFKTLSSWAWPDVQNLDCDAEYNKVGKGNTMYVGMVQIQVTYEPSGPSPGYYQLQYTSEPPIPNAWNQLRRDAGSGAYMKLLFEGEE